MRPVLLVHGFLDTGRIFGPLAAHLAAHGWQPFAPSLRPNDGRGGLPRLADQLARHVDTQWGAEARFDLIGFSMGGLIGRYYVQRRGGAARVRRFVTISSPHRGTHTGHFWPSAGVRQMRPGSAFLQDLDRDAGHLAAHAFTSLWTPYDLMILPASSSVVPFARVVQVPALLHPLMLRDRRVWQVIVETLQAP